MVDFMMQVHIFRLNFCIIQPMLVGPVGVAEYTTWISAERQDSPNECPVDDTKQSDGEAPVMLWGMQSTPLLP